MKLTFTKLKSYLSRAIIALVFVALLVLFILGLSFPSGNFSMFGARGIWVNNSGHMEPYLQNRDIAFVEKDSDFYALQVGDKVAFTSRSVLENGEIREIYVISQIVDKMYHPETGQLSFVTQGTMEGLGFDPHLLTVDGYSYTNTFVGLFSFRARSLGRFISFISSAAGIFVLGLNMFACLVAFILITIVSKDNNQNEFIKEKYDKEAKKMVDKEKISRGEVL